MAKGRGISLEQDQSRLEVRQRAGHSSYAYASPATVQQQPASSPPSLSGAYLPTTLIGDARLRGRGNAPVRIAAMQQMQQTSGNRAVQRLLQRTATSGSAPVQRQAPAPSPPTIAITRDGGVGNTFVSTDTITLKAQVTNAPAAAPAAPAGGAGAGSAAAPGVKWSVKSASTNSGKGKPSKAKNVTTFSFKPNPTNRPKSGSRSPNPPIKYKVEAESGGAKATYDLEQDETDIIRQEYIDYRTSYKPTRADIVSPSNPAYNVGNYSLIVDNGLDTAYSGTTAEFATLTQQAAGGGAGAGGAAPGGQGSQGGQGGQAPQVPVPAVTVTSGYRNPQRNKAVGSQSKNSRHTQGRALDLVVAGANATLWARLRQAGANAGHSSICERGPIQKQCSDPSVDHVHIQW